MDAEITMVADMGASMPRSVYAPFGGKVRMLTLLPYAARVRRESIERAVNRSHRPEDLSWVEYDGTTWAVGRLAKYQFSASICLLSLKSDLMIPFLLAMVGEVLSQRPHQEVALNLGILLPYREFKDAENLKETIAKHLSCFAYRGNLYSVVLKKLVVLPEGAGLVSKGRPGKPNASLVDGIACLMVGYRNASILVFEKGELIAGDTSEFGFSYVVERVLQETVGLSPETVLECLSKNREVPTHILNLLVRGSAPELREHRKRQIAKAIAEAWDEFVLRLCDWIPQKIPLESSRRLREFIIGGGTAHRIREELNTSIQTTYNLTPNWSPNLVALVKQLFGEEAARDDLAVRLPDATGFFYRLSDRSLPTVEVKSRQSRKKNSVIVERTLNDRN